MIPDKYVKIKGGMGAGDIMKSRKSKMAYNISPFEYHADFLTGTTSKIQRYNEPLLFRKLFNPNRSLGRKFHLFLLLLIAFCLFIRHLLLVFSSK